MSSGNNPPIVFVGNPRGREGLRPLSGFNGLAPLRFGNEPVQAGERGRGRGRPRIRGPRHGDRGVRGIRGVRGHPRGGSRRGGPAPRRRRGSARRGRGRPATRSRGFERGSRIGLSTGGQRRNPVIWRGRSQQIISPETSSTDSNEHAGASGTAETSSNAGRSEQAVGRVGRGDEIGQVAGSILRPAVLILYRDQQERAEHEEEEHAMNDSD